MSLSRRPSIQRRGSSPGPASPPRAIYDDDFIVDSGRDNPVEFTDGNENISPLDPRRVTPTLHASLVSEILSLRRDLESKSKIMDSLELSVDSARQETEALTEDLSRASRENRLLRRQMQAVEGGTHDAITELSNERDDALSSIADVCKRLETSQKKVRSQEDELERTQTLWNQDRQKWDDDRRALERKIHVIEGRLKTLISEIAVSQQFESLGHPEGNQDVSARPIDAALTRPHNMLDARRMSVATDDTKDEETRHSMASTANGCDSETQGVLNLAAELGFDEGEYRSESGSDYETPVSRDFSPQRHAASSLSYKSDTKARSVLGMSVGDQKVPGNSAIIEALRRLDPNEASNAEESTIEPQKQSLTRVEYTDVGIQSMSPPSLERSHSIHDGEKLSSSPESDSKSQAAYETVDKSTSTTYIPLVSSSCQTSIELLSDLLPPKKDSQALEPDTQIVTRPPTESTSTQTQDLSTPSTPVREEPVFQIPTIAIHPPSSEPPTPRSSVVLPPATKNASTQAAIELPVATRSFGIQTEEIRIDRRAHKLPASLLPSAISDRLSMLKPMEERPTVPASPIVNPSPRLSFPFPPLDHVPPLPPMLMPKIRDLDGLLSHPGNNDKSHLNEGGRLGLHRPFRPNGLFTRFGNVSDEEWPENSDLDEEDILNRPPMSYTLRAGRLVSKPSLEFLTENDQDSAGSSATDKSPQASRGRRSFGGHQRQLPRPLKLVSATKEPDIRRSTIISSGVAAHQQSFRNRSPSAPDSSAGDSTVTRPPFPVPARFSSRKGPINSNSIERAASPTPRGKSNLSGLERERQEKNGMNDPLRKTRGAAPVPFSRQRSASPDVSPTSVIPDSPPSQSQFPLPLPSNGVMSPSLKWSTKLKAAGVEDVATPISTMGERTYSEGTTHEQISVVDAIAQTMIGEWMWKYVRRRKSFGVSDKESWDGGGKSADESSALVTATGVRHKRWVWIAPYEKAIMWSSKQPTNGTALLGKNGRKLTIQSVLDVKDDTMLPKGADLRNAFSRSILILTPQRALKFTAMAMDRHYAWLTALSFLAHTAEGIGDLTSIPPIPREDPMPPPRVPALRRNPIRDSIRVAKVRGRPGPGRSFSSSNFKQSSAVSAVPGDFSLPPIRDLRYDEDEPCDAPNVPRFSARHMRKRSNTAPRLPPSAFRSFGISATSNSTHKAPSTYSATTAGSSDRHSPTTFAPSMKSRQSSISHRTSEISGPSSTGTNMGPGTGNYVDTAGTMRMEAFVDKQEVTRPRVNDARRRRAKRDANTEATTGPSMQTTDGNSTIDSTAWSLTATVPQSTTYRAESPVLGLGGGASVPPPSQLEQLPVSERGDDPFREF